MPRCTTQVTQDQFDAMDFSDNEIKKLENFPRYKRLSSLLLCNNHVSKISEDLGTSLPNLSCLILTNNKVCPRQRGNAVRRGARGVHAWSEGIRAPVDCRRPPPK